MFIVELSTIAKIWKQCKHPTTNEWMRKMWSACVCIKVAELLPFANSCTEFKGTMLREKVRQSKTNTVCCHLYVESKKKGRSWL